MIISRCTFLSPVLSVLFLTTAVQSQGDKNAQEATDAAQAKVPTQMFAVVDIEEASQHTKAFAAAEEDMVRAQERFQQRIASFKDSLDALEAQIALLRPSLERTEKEIEAIGLQNTIKAAGEIYSQELTLINLKHKTKIYDEMNAAIEDLARRRGIAMVIRKRPIDSLEDIRAAAGPNITEGEALNERSRMFQARDVLYVAPEFDLTEDLIKILKG